MGGPKETPIAHLWTVVSTDRAINPVQVDRHSGVSKFSSVVRIPERGAALKPTLPGQCSMSWSGAGGN